MILVAASVSSARTLNSATNPGCYQQLGRERCQLPRLFYVNASGLSDTIHAYFQLWSQPSVLLLRAPLQHPPQLNWTRLLNSSVDVSGALQANATAALGVSFIKLIEFDDVHDTGDLDKVDPSRSHDWPLSGFRFGDVHPRINGSRVTILSRLSSVSNGWRGNVSFTFDFEAVTGRSRFPSHLQLIGDSSLIQITLSHVHTSSGFKRSRFGLRMLSLSRNDSYQFLDEFRSSDDEYTPGYFTLVNVHSMTRTCNGSASPSPDSVNCSSSDRSSESVSGLAPIAPPSSSSSAAVETGYLQWRPVCYTRTSPSTSLPSSSAVRHYQLRGEVTDQVGVLLRAYFGGANDTERRRVYSLAVTFGAPGDGWYRRTNFTSWYMVVSLGSAPADHFSLFAQLLLFIGAGAPVLLVVFGSIWLCRRQQMPREELEEDQAPLVS